jgi:hypothetical protein
VLLQWAQEAGDVDDEVVNVVIDTSYTSLVTLADKEESEYVRQLREIYNLRTRYLAPSAK